MDQGLSEILQDKKEKIVSALGANFLQKWKSSGDIPQTVVVLTDKRFYQLGTYFERDDAGTYEKAKGEKIIPVADLTGIGITERPVARWIPIVGTILTVVGFGILAWGILDGGAIMLGIGLFVGAIWMGVPGVLMLVHTRTRGEKYLDVKHKGWHGRCLLRMVYGHGGGRLPG